MSRVSPVVFTRPGISPGEIIARGSASTANTLAAAVTDLERRQDDMRRKREGAEQLNRNLIRFTEARIEAAEGAIEDGPATVEKAQADLLKQIELVEDPTLKESMRQTVEAQAAREMSTAMLIQTSREANAAAAVGEQLTKTLGNSLEDGSVTLGEAIKISVDYREAQAENVYGENVQVEKESTVKQLIEIQLDTLLKTDPKSALKFVDGPTAKKWLTVDERDQLRSEVVRTVNSTLLNIESRAVAVTNSLFPNKVELLDDLQAEAKAQPEVARTKLTLTELAARKTLALKQQNRTADRVALGFAVQNGTSNEQHPNEQATLNAMYEQIKSDPGELQSFLNGVIAAGVDFPDNYVNDLARDGDQPTLNLARGVSQLRQVATKSVDRAARLAASAGPVMETAYGATLRIEDPLARQERRDVLSSPDAPGFIAAANESLGDDLLDELETSGVGVPLTLLGLAATGPLAGVTAITGLGVLPFLRNPPVMGPEESTELKDDYLYHYVKARRDLGTDDPAVLKRAALENASADWERSHSLVKITVGRKHSRYIPNNVVSFDKQVPTQQAIGQITREANGLLKTAGSGSGFLSANPIVSASERKTWFAVTNTDGVHGFVEWNGNTGRTKTIRSGEEFDKLRVQMSVRRLNPVPNSDLVRKPGQDTMTTRQQSAFVDMALSAFTSQNGRVPVDTDEDAINAIVTMLKEEKGWID